MTISASRSRASTWLRPWCGRGRPSRPRRCLSRLRKPDPLRAGPGALHGGFDEDHAFDAVVDGGEVEILGQRPAFDLGLDRAKRLAVDVAEGLEIALGMAGGNARELLRARAVVAVAAAPDLRGLVRELHEQLVRMLLVPLEAALGAVDADAERVF